MPADNIAPKIVVDDSDCGEIGPHVLFCPISFLLLSALFQTPGQPFLARHLDTACKFKLVLGDRVISFFLTQILASLPFNVFHTPESFVYMTESNSFVDHRCGGLHVLFEI